MWDNRANAGAATSTSIPWNREYATVSDLENSLQYRDFTDYVINNTSDDNVMSYLKKLDAQARKSGSQQGLLFTGDDQTTLNEGWADEYKRLRTNGKYGYSHLTPEIQSKGNVPTASVAKTSASNSTTPTNEETVESNTLTVPGDYQSAEYLPGYKKGLYTDWAHLGAIYANNMRGLRKQRDLGLQQKVALDQAPQQNAIVTDGYAERKANEAAKNEMLSRAANMASNSANAEQQRAILEQANETAGQFDMQNNRTQAATYNQESKDATAVGNWNSQQRQAYANSNNQKLVADWNSKLNTLANYEANKTAQTSDFINKLDQSYSTYQQQEKANALAHNQAINEYMLGVERDRAWKGVQDWQNSGFRTMDYGGGRTYDGLINYITSGGDEELLSKMSDADLQALQENTGDASIVIPVLERYAQDSDEIRAFLAAYKSKLSTLEDDYFTRAQDLMSHYKKLGLYQKQYYGSDPGWKRDGLNVNWSTMPYYKSGGKVYDRVLKYIEHNRKVANDRDKRAANAEKEAQKKLLRDLDSLDRETMLLLRAIFK